MSSPMDEVYEKRPDIHSGKPRHRAIADLVEGPRVLDFGCGAGDLLMLLQDERPDWHLAGVDTSETARILIKERGFTGPMFCGDNPNGVGKYNTVVAAQVLEHVDDDEGTVMVLGDALEPDGLLIASVPNDGQVLSPDHKRVYTVESLRELLSHLGVPALHLWSGRATRILMSVRKVKNDTL